MLWPTTDPVMMQGGLYVDPFKLFNQIPGFISFAMPNEGEHMFGYNNSFPFTTRQHADNAQVLLDWMEIDTDNALLQFVPAGHIS